jgi:P27 family predicted phage terminase small subunit
MLVYRDHWPIPAPPRSGCGFGRLARSLSFCLRAGKTTQSRTRPRPRSRGDHTDSAKLTLSAGWTDPGSILQGPGGGSPKTESGPNRVASRRSAPGKVNKVAGGRPRVHCTDDQKGVTMRTGRPPKTKALHLLHGNPSHKRLDDIEEPVTCGPLGDAPQWLDESAREVWSHLQNVMPLGLVASCDKAVMCSYCAAVALYQRAVVQLRKTGGAVVRNHDGDLVKNPWLYVQDRQALLILRLASELGLTPTARASMAARLSTADVSFVFPGQAPRPRDELEAYLAAAPDRLPEQS